MASYMNWIPIQPPTISSFVLFCKDNKVSLWHGRLDHPSSTSFQKILSCIIGHNLQSTHVNTMTLCQACVQGILIAKSSLWKLPHKLPPILSRLDDDICGPITPIS